MKEELSNCCNYQTDRGNVWNRPICLKCGEFCKVSPQKKEKEPTPSPSLDSFAAEKIKEFEERWRDNGDERYGLVKHNNTILRHQLDWLSQAFHDLREQVRKEDMAIIENEMPNILHEFNRELNYSEAYSDAGPLERKALKEKYTKQLLSSLTNPS